MTRAAGPVRARDMAALTDAALRCRDKGHQWKHKNDVITLGTRERPREVVRHFTCSGCTTKQRETLEWPSCRVKRRTYEYPDHYLLLDGLISGQRVYVQDFRRELLERTGLMDRPVRRKAGSKQAAPVA